MQKILQSRYAFSIVFYSLILAQNIMIILTMYLYNFCFEGFRAFKMKTGRDRQDDIRRAKIMRESIGDECLLMMDSNQVWDIETAISWMKDLAFVKPYFIEEPTCPDDILGHAAIARALNKIGIKVATGEVCQNKVCWRYIEECTSISSIYTLMNICLCVFFVFLGDV